MINSVSSNLQTAQLHQSQQHQQNTQNHKNVQNDQEPQDTVVLSKQASQSGDVDHDGDNH